MPDFASTSEIIRFGGIAIKVTYLPEGRAPGWSFQFLGFAKYRYVSKEMAVCEGLKFAKQHLSEQKYNLEKQLEAVTNALSQINCEVLENV